MFASASDCAATERKVTVQKLSKLFHHLKRDLWCGCRRKKQPALAEAVQHSSTQIMSGLDCCCHPRIGGLRPVLTALTSWLQSTSSRLWPDGWIELVETMTGAATTEIRHVWQINIGGITDNLGLSTEAMEWCYGLPYLSNRGRTGAVKAPAIQYTAVREICARLALVYTALF